MSGNVGYNSTASDNISVEVENYLNEVLDIMEVNSINKIKINWDEFRKDVLNKAKNINSIDSTYSIIRYAIKKLGDNHSFFVENYSEIINKFKTNYPFSRLLEHNIAYIHIPSFIGNDFKAKEYATRLYNYIKFYSTKNVKGWILDLRENKGGNMWPMLAGLSPLLGDEVVGYFINPDRVYTKWNCKNGSSYLEDSLVCSIIGEPKDLLISESKVAVLIGGFTASSGEAVVVSFKGRKNTKFYGEPTRGLSTGNDIFKLSNDACLILTTSIFIDRNKNEYGNVIEPDILIYNPYKINKKENDKVIVKAMEWISNNK
jgi:C-terminal processing protease CtpA/Prc